MKNKEKGGPRTNMKLSSRSVRSLQQCGSGVSMNVKSVLAYPVKRISKIRDISRKAKVRLQVLEFAKEHPVSVTCRRFGISRSTYYWKKRFDPGNLRSLEDRSRRPRNVRRPKWSVELVEAVKELREQFPRWGKVKLAVLLKGQGFEVSESTVGRILRYLKHRGVLREPAKKVKARSTPRRRVYAIRKPKEYKAEKPGDLVQIDTLDIRPEPGCVYKQFSASDVVSRWSFADVRSAATAFLAKEFLEALIEASPFRIKAIQVDGGSEFYAEFEDACKAHGVKLFCLPPRSPKLNEVVERMHRTYREEFWACYDGELRLETMRAELKRWALEVYNHLRPHQSLGYKSPAQYLELLGMRECLT